MEQAVMKAEPAVAARPPRRRRAAWLALGGLVVVAAVFVLTPVFVIMPFKAQTVREMEISYALKRWSPLITLISFIAVGALIVWLWRGALRWWRKGLLVAALILTGANAWMARQNHFEWMFRPLAAGVYAPAGEAAFVAGRDMVMAVEVNGEAVAYPVRQMAYHHVVQDRVGGTELVATY